LIARLFHAYAILLITNTNGVYRDPSDTLSRIQQIQSSDITDAYIKTLCSGKSKSGTGGMSSKLDVAREA